MNDATYGLVIRRGGRDRALRTSATRVSGITNGNLLWRRCHGRRLGIGRGKCRESENGELGVHLEEREWRSAERVVLEVTAGVDCDVQQ